MRLFQVPSWKSSQDNPDKAPYLGKLVNRWAKIKSLCIILVHRTDKSTVLMSKSDPPPKKVQVSTLQLRKKLEDLANPVPRRSISVSQKHSLPSPPPLPRKVQERLEPTPSEKISPPLPKPIEPPPVNRQAKEPEPQEAPPAQTAKTPKKAKSSVSFFWRHLPSLLVLAEIGGILAVLWLGVVNLVEPDLSAKLLQSCQGKLQGKWQTRWGNLDFTETNDGLIKGKFQYKNIDRGQVKGELSGKLDGVALRFSWQETHSDKSKQNGSGIFIFGEDCQEFYGNTGAVGSWQGRRITPSSPPPSPLAKPPAR